ncbi:MAG: hypothetical protein GC164_13820 [Phycisphaera sp.]|nr:hypothetical protein [Phycisphaera sp.]
MDELWGRPIHRILLVRPSALGDVCRTVPTLVTLKRAFPGARIDWLVRDLFTDAVASHPDLAGVVAYSREVLGNLLGPSQNLRLAREWVRSLRGARYDLVVDLQGLFRSGLFTRLSGAPLRVGERNARELGWLGYNRKIDVDPSLHAVDRMLAVLWGMGLELSHDMRLYVSDRDLAWSRTLVDEPFACVAPTARWRCKCWPIEGYTRASKRLLDSGLAGRKLVVIASPGEQAQVEPLLAGLRDAGLEKRVIVPMTSVGQMMALVGRCEILLCNDSAPLHVAVGFDRRIVSVFGPTDPAKVGPYRRPDAVVEPEGVRPEDRRGYRKNPDDQSLISRVNFTQLWARVEEVLAQRPTPRPVGPHPGS